MSYYYNVIVAEKEEYNEFANQLNFVFCNLDEAMRFVEDMLEISDYDITILKFTEKGGK